MAGIIIFGAGQAGLAAWRLMQRRDGAVTAFADNNRALEGTTVAGLPVLSAQQAAAENPDEILIAVTGKDRSEAVAADVRAAGYTGTITFFDDVRQRFDIRLATCRRLAEEAARLGVSGAVAELGVYRGDFSAELSRMFPDRKIYLYDTFAGFDARDLAAGGGEDGPRAASWDFSGTSVELVLGKMLYPERVIVRAGYFPESIAESDFGGKFAAVSLDADLYGPTRAGLEFFYPRLSPGGFMILDDFESRQFPGAGKAIREFCAATGVFPVPLCDVHGTAVLVKPRTGGDT